jgi:hypothetical protein
LREENLSTSTSGFLGVLYTQQTCLTRPRENSGLSTTENFFHRRMRPEPRCFRDNCNGGRIKMEHSPTVICSTADTAFSRQGRVRFFHGQLSASKSPTLIGETPGCWVKCSCGRFNGASKGRKQCEGNVMRLALRQNLSSAETGRGVSRFHLIGCEPGSAAQVHEDPCDLGLRASI